IQFEVEYEFPPHIRNKIDEEFLNAFSMKDTYYECIDNGQKGKDAVELSVRNHADAIIKAVTNFYDGLELQEFLQEHVEHRLKQYTKCISKSTANYFKYLMETYNRQLRQILRNELDDEEEDDE